jgi:hypothetical protein
VTLTTLNYKLIEREGGGGREAEGIREERGDCVKGSESLRRSMSNSAADGVRSNFSADGKPEEALKAR